MGSDPVRSIHELGTTRNLLRVSFAAVMPSTPPTDSSTEHDAAERSPSVHRRGFLAGAASVASLGTAGCLNVLDGDTGSSSTAAGSDWHTYRGDLQRTGLAPADAGPGESLSVAWETSVLDVIEAREGVSAERPTDVENGYDGHTAVGFCREVTLTDDLVLTTAEYRLYEGDEEESSWGGVVALDPGSGSVEWTIAGLGGSIQAPTVIDDRLFLFVVYPIDADVDGSHVLVADAATGDVEARHPVPGNRRAAPTIAENAIYHEAPDDADGGAVAIDPDGADRDWLADAPRPRPELQPFTVADGSIVYGGYVDEETQALVALDPETGDEQWRRELDFPRRPPGVGLDFLGAPAVVDGTGYVAGRWREFWSNDVGGTALRSFGLDGGEDQWTFRPDGVPYEEVLSRDVTSVGCMDAEACEVPDERAALHGTPLVVDDLVVVPGFGQPAPDGQSHELHRHLYAVSRSDGSLEWTIPGVAASPVAAGDVIYARLAGDVVLAISTDGSVLDRVGIDDGSSWGRSPSIGHGRVYTAWGSDEGRSPRIPDRIAAIE